MTRRICMAWIALGALAAIVLPLRVTEIVAEGDISSFRAHEK